VRSFVVVGSFYGSFDRVRSCEIVCCCWLVLWLVRSCEIVRDRLLLLARSMARSIV